MWVPKNRWLRIIYRPWPGAPWQIERYNGTCHWKRNELFSPAHEVAHCGLPEDLVSEGRELCVCAFLSGVLLSGTYNKITIQAYHAYKGDSRYPAYRLVPVSFVEVIASTRLMVLYVIGWYYGRGEWEVVRAQLQALPGPQQRLAFMLYRWCEMYRIL